ncbi:thiamine phosphate synthase [Corynebacterium mendelii]|uniref:Thiamine-phosphate synthase n=1 Tax=Corynebacterium mendelii TaxID=2765362 RepID=A0A939DZU5_9CORY|nr:thiamine phosphate synthase [Corynebacterium mendelii]MBN9643859.1 thiamine phosphate synthase [Corynebacterium mendelii]
MTPDYRLYLVTKGTDDTTIATAAAVAAAGAGIVQVRVKDATARQLTAFTVAVAEAVRRANPTAVTVVDDRADVAFAARAAGAPVHGVHLGQDDLSPIAARAMLGPDALIGLTTGTLDLVRQAQQLLNRNPGVIDYLGCGPFRPTPTKNSGRPPLGVAGYRPIVDATTLPVIAIGDVTADDVADLSATGIAGCAMVRSLMDADDPAAEARQALANFRAAG